MSNLAKDIRGIGFISADKIAKNIGIKEDSIIRARAGIGFALMEALSEGHIALPLDLLIKTSEKLLSINKSILERALELELADEYLIKDEINSEPFIFLAAYHTYEKNIAYRLKKLKESKVTWGEIDADKAVPWAEERLDIRLSVNQKNAVIKALNNKALVITGGPGTGKTTILNCIITILKAKKVKIKLCAPTGRAAKRLSDTTGSEAYTIHRLLKYEPGLGDFKYNEQNQLDCDLLINSLRVMGFNNNEDVSLLFRMLISYIVLKVKNKVIQIK